MPGRRRSTVSVSDSLPSPTSCRATVATNDFVMLAARKRSPGRSARLSPVSATPAACSRTAWPSLTNAMTPGEPAATTALSCEVIEGRGAVAVEPADAAAVGTGAALLDLPPQAAVKAPAGAISAAARRIGLDGGALRPASTPACGRARMLPGEPSCGQHPRGWCSFRHLVFALRSG